MQTRIKELREEKGISQEVLAGFVNSSQQAICRYERNVSSPPAHIAVAIANYFGVSTDYLLCCSDVRVTVEAEAFDYAKSGLLDREIAMLRQLEEKNRQYISEVMEKLIKGQEQKVGERKQYESL